MGDARLIVLLVRHGQTAWNRERRFLGIADLPLDEEGEAQARRLGACLSGRFDRVYCSPLRRARDTALCLAEQPIHNGAWAEMRQGEVEGLSRDEAIARFPGVLDAWLNDPVDRCMPGGETLRACRDRAWSALEELAVVHDSGVIAVVTHQVVIASVTCTVHGDPLLEWRKHTVPNTGCTLLIRDRDRWRAALPRFRPSNTLALESVG